MKHFLVLLLPLLVTIPASSADKKFSDLNALSAASWATGDLLAISDVSANETKKTTIADFDTRYLLLSTATRTANTFFAGPTSGSAAAATWRLIDPLDIPNLSASKITSGQGTLSTSTTGVTIGTGTSTLLSDASINIQNASGSQPGLLASTDWTTFNNKQATVTNSAPITFAGNVIGITQAATGASGYLSSTDWNTFNGKQATVLTTKGDILGYGSSIGRLAVGSDGFILKADSTQTFGVIWAANAPAYAVASKTTTYTVTTSDNVIAGSTSGGAWTLTLYTAVGNTGKILTFVKTDTSNNLWTIDPNSSETIFGKTTIVLSGQNDTVSCISDGSNWIPLTPEGAYRTVSVLLSGNGVSAPTTSVEYGNWVSSTSRANLGIYAITIRSGVFSAAPAVQLTAVRNLDNDRYLVGSWMPSSPSTTNIDIHLGYADDQGGTTDDRQVRDDSSSVSVVVRGPR